MKLEVGQFVRYRRGSMGYNIKPVDKIGKIINQVNGSDIYELDNNNNIFENDVVKASFNIIDLIEAGDYVNGIRVEKNKYGELYTSYVYYGGDIGKQCEVYTNWLKEFKEDMIYNIVTKEQFKQTSYRVGDKI